MDRGGGWVWEDLGEKKENSLNENCFNKMLKELAIIKKNRGEKETRHLIMNENQKKILRIKI